MTDFQKFLTDWTEVDPANRLTQTDPRSTWTALARGDALTHLSEDLGVAFFGVSQRVRFTFEITALDSVDADNNVLGALIGISNNAADPTVDPHIRVDIVENGADDTTFKLTLDISEVGAATDSDTTDVLDVGTTYYCILGRTFDGALVWLSVYSDSIYATKVTDAITYVANFDDTLRYMFAPWKANYGTDVNDYTDGYVENLIILPFFVDGLYHLDSAGIKRQLAIVSTGGGMEGFGGIPVIRKGGVNYDVFLVEVTDPRASQVSLETTTATKAVMLSPDISHYVGEPDMLAPASTFAVQVNTENEVVLSPASTHHQHVGSENEVVISPASVHHQQVNTENEVVLSPDSTHHQQVNAEQEKIISPASTFANPVTAPEDFDLFTQVEEQVGDIVTDQYFADLSLSQNETTYLFFDYGVGALAGVDHDMKLSRSGSGEGAVWLAANVVKGEKAMIDAVDAHIMVYLDNGNLYVMEWDAVGNFFTGALIAIGSGPYWLTITKAGLNFSVVVYDGPRRNNALGTSALVLQANYTFRYLFIGNSRDDGGGGNITLEADYLVV